MNDKQNSFKFRFISLLILLVFDFNPVFSYISLPLEYLPKKNYQFLKTDNLINKPELVMKDLFYKRLITHLNIGTPEKNQMMLIDTNDNDFYFTSLNPPSDSKGGYKFSQFYDFGENLFYNESESSSYILEQCHEDTYHGYKEICFAKELIKFNFGNYTSVENFPIKVAKGEDEPIPGVIGLSINDSMAYTLRSFLSELKLTNLVNDYYFFFDYEKFYPLNSIIKGNLILGDLPHNIFPDKYSKEDFVTMKKTSSSSFWTHNMNKIEVQTNNTKKDIQITNTKVHTFYEFYNVIGTLEFIKQIKELFLDELIENKKCFRGKFTQNLFSYDDINFFYCDISVENILIQNLSGIKFYSKDFDYTFELTKDELYYKKGKYIYLTVLYFNHLYNDWIVGQMFTSKYNFVFNTDTREIGFYKKVNNVIHNDNTDNNNNSDGNSLINGENKVKMLTIIIIVSSCILIIGIVIGLVIGIKFLKNKRKKRADELIDDEYEYTSKTEDNNIN